MDHVSVSNKHLLLGVMVYLFHGTYLLEGPGFWKGGKIHYLGAEKSLIFPVFTSNDFTDLITKEIKRTGNVALKRWL